MTIATNKIISDKFTDPHQPEIDLLLLCTDTNIYENTKKQINLLLKEKIDWSYLIEMSQKHKILPLVSSNLKNINCEDIPDDSKILIDNFFRFNTNKNLALIAELLKILNLFHENKIKSLPLKGPILSKLAYGDFGFRAVSDLDIIVRKQDFDKAQKLLVQYSYSPSSRNNWEYYRQASFSKPLSLVCIDLHYEFSPINHFVSVDTNLFWKNLETVTIANQNIEIFSPEYMLVYLCLEGGKEHWRSFNRICDVSKFISSREIDWELLLNSIELLEKKKNVFLGLFLAHTLFDIPIPKYLEAQINNYIKITLSKKEICNFLFRRNFNFLLAIQWHLFNLQTFKFLDKFRYLFQVAKVNIQVRWNISKEKQKS